MRQWCAGWPQPLTNHAGHRHSACYRSSHAAHPFLDSKKEERCMLATQNASIDDRQKEEQKHTTAGIR